MIETMTAEERIKKDEEEKKLFLRILSDKPLAGDGKEFIEYLKNAGMENYEAFKDEAESGDFHRGYGIAIDNMIESFIDCSKEPTRTAKPDTA